MSMDYEQKVHELALIVVEKSTGASADIKTTTNQVIKTYKESFEIIYEALKKESKYNTEDFKTF
jgi:hypothetical protein